MRLKLTAVVLALLVSVGIGLATGAASAQAGARFGVGLHPLSELPSAAEFAAMDRGRVASMRVQLYWPHIQRTPSNCSAADPEGLLATNGCDWSATDQVVRGAANAGIRVLPFFYGTPGWLRFAGGGDASSPVASAEARAKWQELTRAAAQRYGPNGVFWSTYPGPAQPVTTWEIWNEQNSKSKWAPRPSPKDYSTLLKLAHTAITGVNPDARLMLGGMFGTPNASKDSLSAWRFLDRLYEVKGIKSKFDQVAAHPYAEDLRGIKYQLNKLRRVMDANRDRRTKLAITEIGWGSDKSQAPHTLNKGLKGQRDMLQKSFGLFRERRRSWNLGTIYWFSLSDVGNCQTSCDYWDTSSGLFRSGEPLDPKPSWRAFTKFTGGTP